MTVRIVNCLVVVECDDEEAMGIFQQYCAKVMDVAARQAIELLGEDTIRLVRDVRVGEEIAVDEGS